MLDFDTLAARSLNASRIAHKPTYAGLRLLLRAAQHHPTAIVSLINNRCQDREAWRYYSFQILKEVGKSNTPTYRNCVIGSPLTTIAEAFVMGVMATQAAFQPPSCAFSYLWPTSIHSGRSFEYFYEGYARRNRRIGELLTANPSYVALVTDIKSFYPNVNKERLRRKVTARIRRISDKAVARPIEKFLDALLTLSSPQSEGIPIGPEIAHVFGHVALEDVDAAMHKVYGDYYLRYVDDIVVVCAASEVECATDRLRDALNKEGLHLHEEKHDVVDGIAWRTSDNSTSARPDFDLFGLLIDEITFYLLHNPEKMESLRNTLVDNGFSLPLRRLGHLVKSRRFRSHKRLVFRGQRGLLAWAKGWFITEASIVKLAIAVRNDMLAIAGRLAEQVAPTQPTAHKSYIQKRRFVFNRLLYLMAPENYASLLQLIPDTHDFIEIRLLAEALQAKNASAVLRYPGRIVDTFCQLWSERNDTRQPSLDWAASPSRAVAESVAHMALYFPVEPDKSFLNGLACEAPGSCILLDVCTGAKSIANEIQPFSFLDELELLYRASSPDDVRQLVATRYDEMEEIGFEALLLGGTSSPFSFDDGGYVY